MERALWELRTATKHGRSVGKKKKNLEDGERGDEETKEHCLKCEETGNWVGGKVLV